MQNYLNFAFLPTLILIYLILVYPSQDINKSQNVEGENVELQPQSAFTNINKYKYNHTSIVTLSIAFGQCFLRGIFLLQHMGGREITSGKSLIITTCLQFKD